METVYQNPVAPTCRPLGEGLEALQLKASKAFPKFFEFWQKKYCGVGLGDVNTLSTTALLSETKRESGKIPHETPECKRSEGSLKTE
jgi:hypothetical protein